MSFLAARQPSQAGQTVPSRWRDWKMHLHIWEGCDFLAWWHLLLRNRFAVNWRFWYVAVAVTFVSMGHTILKVLQQIVYGRRLRQARIERPPLFIVGHWRSGTTLLHELLIRDPRHSFPTTYQCLAPNHFVLSENIAKRVLGLFMPGRRPMDNMAAGWDRPQEDEFALCMLGQPSPYAQIAFPNRSVDDDGTLDLTGLPPRQLRGWKRTFAGFLKQLAFIDPGKRLVLKSPPHSARIGVLQALFPEARFLHIVRDPFVVFPSTVNLWKSLYREHGLQKPTFAGLEEKVFRTFVRLHERLEEGRRLLGPRRFHELKYEDLTRNPIGELEKAYQALDLGDFAPARPLVEEYLASVKNYETNKYALTEEQRAKVTERWGDIIRRHGY